MKYFSLFLFTFFMLSLYGQRQPVYYKSYKEAFERTEQTKIYYHVYDLPFEAKPILQEKGEIDLNYPEQLMISIASATNQKWVNYNTYSKDRDLMYKPPAYFAKKKKWDPDKNYLSLTSKLQFEMDGVEYALMRFHAISEHSDRQPIGVYVFRKTKSRWYGAPNALSDNLIMTMLYFKIDLLEAVLIGKKNENPYMDELIDRVHDENGINLMLLGDVVASWSEVEKEGKDKQTYFFDKIDW